MKKTCDICEKVIGSDFGVRVSDKAGESAICGTCFAKDAHIPKVKIIKSTIDDNNVVYHTVEFTEEELKYLCGLVKIDYHRWEEEIDRNIRDIGIDEFEDSPVGQYKIKNKSIAAKIRSKLEQRQIKCL